MIIFAVELRVELLVNTYLSMCSIKVFAVPSAPTEDMDPVVAVVVIAQHLARLSTAYFPKPTNLNSEDGFTGEVDHFYDPTTLFFKLFIEWV